MRINRPVQATSGAPEDVANRRRAIAITFGFLVMLTQRLGITVGLDGSVQSATIIGLLLIGWIFISGEARLSPAGLVLWLLLIMSGGLSALAAPDFSLPSFVLLLATYVVILVGGNDRTEGLGGAFFLGVVRAVKLGAALGVAQWLFQRAGLGFFDPISLLPSEVLRTGFNTHYDLQYAGGVKGEFKPNGVLFLEPSLLSLFTAIALVYCIWEVLRKGSAGDGVKRWVWIFVLGAGFAVSASASGVVVLAAAAVPLLVRSVRRIGVLIALIAVSVIALQIGIFDAVLGKAQENLLNPNTSAALRLWLPYELLTPYWLQSPFIGSGPGSASIAIDELGRAGLQASTTMKILVEYGLLGATVIGGILVRAIWATRAPTALVFAIFAAWLIPAEALLNSTLVLMLAFAVPQWGRSRQENEPLPAKRARRPTPALARRRW